MTLPSILADTQAVLHVLAAAVQATVQLLAQSSRNYELFGVEGRD